MILMHEDIPVAKVEMYLGHISNVLEVYNKDHLPIGTNHKNPLLTNYLDAWLTDRTIPINRHSIELYTTYFGHSPLIASQVSGGFSLTDHYWFKEEDSTEKWEDLCLQKNGFPDDFSKFFLKAIAEEEMTGDNSLRIPDIHTDGVLPKIWVQGEDNEYYLIKFGDLNNEDGCNLLSANEVACHRIANLMGMNSVPYFPIQIPGLRAPVCCCKNFIPEDAEFITLAQIIKAHAGLGLFDIYKYLLEQDLKKEIEEIIKLFFLIHNKDGHTKNIGLLRNAKTGEIIGLAPIFDLGCSLNYDRLGNKDNSVKPFKDTRLEQVSLLTELGDLPSFHEVSKIIKNVYEEFNIPETQLAYALEDLIETYKEWDKLKEAEREDIEFI